MHDQRRRIDSTKFTRSFDMNMEYTYYDKNGLFIGKYIRAYPVNACTH